MKRILNILILCLCCLFSTQIAKADIKDLLSKLGSGSGSGLSGVVDDLIGGEVEYNSLVGDWAYASPAVSFKSENLLKKAGGVAAAAKVEQEIEPYYSKVGLTGLTMTFKADSTFTMKVKRLELKGTVKKDEKGEYKFEFKAFGKIKTGAMTAYISRSGENVKLTFDVSKLITLVEKISSVTNNSTIKGLSTLLSSYDGLNAGFELKKTSK